MSQHILASGVGSSVLAGLIAFGPAAGHGSSQAGTTIPSSVAAVPPETFVWYLVKARMPAGLEIHLADRVVETIPQAVPPVFAAVTTGNLVSAFNTGHSRYKADLEGGVLVVRPRDRRSAYLDALAPPGRIQTRGIMTAARALFAPLSPLLNSPGGWVGSALGGIEDTGEDVKLDIDAEGITVVSVLNAIARSAPGHGWLVVTTDQGEPDIMRIGFMHAKGSSAFQFRIAEVVAGDRND
jgi:hypothetical protein